MLKEVLCEVGRKLQELDGVATQAPILVLDIPRETRKGMDLISILAKELSSDKRGAAAHVIVCASSAAMAMAFDAGGRQRQKDIWVGDLTDDEAERLLALHGHKEDWLQFTEECGLRALDLVSACERYTGPESLGTMKADMEQEARKEVKKFLLCKFQTLDGIIPAGSNILTALKTNRDSGDGQGVDEMSVGLGASPRDVTNWIREKDAHPVIWHLPDSKYRFASELHAKVAAEILDSQSQSSP
ncbi:unnamed protein product [Effrenium voratum]|nr:unnamed protein product [Effrenium voratum]